MNLCLKDQLGMDISDEVFICNRDWDPVYLSGIFDEEFFDFSDMWRSSVSDGELVSASQKVKKQISLSSMDDESSDDIYLRNVVEQLEEK